MVKKKSFSIGIALSQGLEDTIHAAEKYKGELKVDIIPLNKVDLDPSNPRNLILEFNDVKNGIVKTDANLMRKRNELESLQSLATSISEQGIINPIVVYKNGDRYRIIAGERRTLASLLAKQEAIQAKILEDKPDDLKISLLQWIENVERSDLSLWERIKNLEKIATTYLRLKQRNYEQITITELSNLLGCSKPHAMNYRSVLYANTTIKDLIQENKIKNLEKAACLAEINDEHVKQHAITACLNGATLRQLKLLAQAKNLKKKTSKHAYKISRTKVINFGKTTNSKIANIVLQAILTHGELKHLAQRYHELDQNNFDDVNHAFKDILHLLEITYA